MSYEPNFADPRIQRRVKQALTSVELYMKPGQIHQVSSSQQYKFFGNTSRPLGEYLKKELLTVTDKWYSIQSNICQKYTRNELGIKRLKDLVNHEYQPVPELVEQFRTGEFVYESKSSRLFTPAQFIPKRIRVPLAASQGMKYHYDIQAAAPRLLLQRAQLLNPKLVCTNLDYYIINRSQVREQIAKDCEISSEKVKMVINAILQGGVISAWNQNKIFSQLNYSYDAIKKLNNNPMIAELKKDIRNLWKSLRGNFSEEYISDKNGKQIRKKITSKQKSQLYRDLEDEVGQVIRKLLKKNKIKHLWLHDGWHCDQVIDPIVIVDQVRRQTGLVLELDWTIYED
jgi:hypothetical protein